jgi:hypothetical protein
MNSIANKEASYSLHNSDNYKKELESEIGQVAEKMSELLIDYFKFITYNIKLKKNNLSRFIITRGLDTVINVFNHILLYTKNLDVTYFHCQKAFYFYSEFVSQISEDEKMFLQLSSRDATTYVYKKTIYEINSELKKKNEYISNYTRQKLDVIHSYTNLYKIFILKLINNYENNNISDNTVSDKNINNVNSIESLFKKLYIINNKCFIAKLNDVLEILYYKIDNFNTFYDISNLIIKKTIKKTELLNNCDNKYLLEEFNDRLNEPSDKFVSWFIN